MRNAVTKIRLLKHIQPNPDWLKSQRRNLLLELESDKQSRKVWSLPGFSLSNFALKKSLALKPVLVSLVLFCLIFGSGLLTVWAAKNSLPGDLLYPIKISLENARVKVSSTESKPRLQAELVKTRIEELNRIIKETRDLAEKKERVVKAVDGLHAQVVSTVNSKVETVEAAKAISEKASQAEEALIEAKEKIAAQEGPEEAQEVIEIIDETLTTITDINKKTEERVLQMEVKKQPLKVEEINKK